MPGRKYASLNPDDMIVEIEEIPSTASEEKKKYRVFQRDHVIAYMGLDEIGKPTITSKLPNTWTM